MSEYIDKDKLLNAIECIDISNCTDVDDIFIEIERTIDEQPTADVVEVVRCKDCKNYDNQFSVDNCGWCDEFNCGTSDERFCSYGERKEVKNNA